MLYLKAKKNELIIRFRAGLSESEASEKVREQGYQPIDFMAELNAMLVELPAGKAASQAVSSLSNDPEVLSASRNNQFEIYDYVIPDDNHYERQWGSSVMRLPQTWRDNTGSNNVRIAVLDTGINHHHEDLAANINLGDGYNFADENSDSMDRHGMVLMLLVL